MAIASAFAYQGRPHDFDFLSDVNLVCTEPVWKSYAPSAGMKGLALPLAQVAGAADVAGERDRQEVRPGARFAGRQQDFVAFLDGREGEGDAVSSRGER